MILIAPGDARRIVVHEWRRTLRSIGFLGRRGPALTVAISLTVVLVEVTLCVLAWRWSRYSETSFLAPVLAAALLYLAGGMVLMVVDPTAARMETVRTVLVTLPVSAPGLRVRILLPTMVIGLGIVALVAPPGIAVLTGFGMAPWTSVGTVLLVLLVGMGHAMLLNALVRLAMPASGLAATHYALAVVGLVAIMGVSVYGLVDPALLDNVLMRGLQLPLLLERLADGLAPTHPEAIALLATAVLLIIGGAAITLRVRLSAWAPRSGPWGRIARRSLFELETTRLLRNPVLSGNLLVVVLIGSGLTALCLAAPDSSRVDLLTPVVVTIVYLAAVPARMLRGLERLRLPKPIYTGLAPGSWIRLLYVAHALVFLVGCLPAVVLLAVDGRAVAWSGLLLATAVAYGSSLVLTWVVPLDMRNPSSQVGATFTLIVLQGAMNTPTLLPAPWSGIAATVVAVSVLAAGLRAGWLVEPARWTLQPQPGIRKGNA